MNVWHIEHSQYIPVITAYILWDLGDIIYIFFSVYFPEHEKIIFYTILLKLSFLICKSAMEINEIISEWRTLFWPLWYEKGSRAIN